MVPFWIQGFAARAASLLDAAFIRANTNAVLVTIVYCCRSWLRYTRPECREPGAGAGPILDHTGRRLRKRSVRFRHASRSEFWGNLALWSKAALGQRKCMDWFHRG